MKKLLITCLVTALVLSLVAACAKPVRAPAPAPAPEAVKPIVLRYTDYGPPTGGRAEAVIWMLREIEKRSDNRVKFEEYWGGSLLSMQETLPGIMKGVADLGWIPVFGYEKEVPLWLATQYIWPGPTNHITMSNIQWKLYDELPALRAEWLKWNQMLVGLFSMATIAIATKKQVSTLDDLKGLRIRAPQEDYLIGLKAVGAVPVFLAVAECYGAIEKGTLDGIMSGVDAIHKFKIQEVATHLLMLPMKCSGSVPPTTINLDSWNKLPKDIQRIMLEVGREQAQKRQEVSLGENERYIADWKKVGGTIVDLPRAESLRWSEMPTVKALPEMWVDKTKKAGQPGEVVMNRLLELFKEAGY